MVFCEIDLPAAAVASAAISGDQLTTSPTSGYVAHPPKTISRFGDCDEASSSKRPASLGARQAGYRRMLPLPLSSTVVRGSFKRNTAKSSDRHPGPLRLPCRASGGVGAFN